MVSRIISLVLGVLMPMLAVGDDGMFARRMLKESVYKVTNISQAGWGTGFSVKHGNNHYFVTNRHVCEMLQDDKLPIRLVHHSSPLLAYPSKVLTMSKRTDLCLLEHPDNLKSKFYLSIWGTDSQVYTAGHPGHAAIRTLTGYKTSSYTIVTSMNKTESDEHCLEPITIKQKVESIFKCFVRVVVDEYDFLPLPGHSGSPVITKYGGVVGVVFAYNTGTLMGLAIPATELEAMIREYENE